MQWAVVETNVSLRCDVHAACDAFCPIILFFNPSLLKNVRRYTIQTELVMLTKLNN